MLVSHGKVKILDDGDKDLISPSRGSASTTELRKKFEDEAIKMWCRERIGRRNGSIIE